MTKLKHFLFASALAALTTAGYAQTTYTWNVASGSFTDAASWTPNRVTPATNDILVFDGGVTATAAVTGVATQTIGKLSLVNNATISFNTTVAANQVVTLAGGANAFSVGAGSKLTFLGGSSTGYVTLALPTGSTGSVAGTITFQSGTSAPHRILVQTAGGLEILSGGVVEMAPTSSGAGGGFGGTGAAAPFTLAVDGVVFRAGSAFYQAGTSTGTYNGGTGSNPFSAATPNQFVKFELGARYVAWDGIPSIAGRTYGTFEWRGTAVDQNNTGSTEWVVLGDTIFGTTPDAITRPTGSGPKAFGLGAGFLNAVTFHGDFIAEAGGTRFVDAAVPTVDRAVNFKGDLTLATAAQFTPNTNPFRIYAFNGSANQTLKTEGLTLNRVEFNNAAGLTLASNLVVSGSLNITGPTPITQTTGTLVLAQGATVTGTLAANPIARSVNAAAVGSAAFPLVDGPVSIDVTAAGTGTGTIAVGTAAGAGASLPVGATGIARTWTITPTGITGGTYTVTFTYSDGELNGATEADLKAARFNGSTWDVLSASTVDTVANTVTVTGVTDFSTWTLLDAPDASVPAWDMYND